MNIFSLFGLFCPKKFNVYLSAENMLISFNQPKKNRTTYSPANVAISVWNGGGGEVGEGVGRVVRWCIVKFWCQGVLLIL